MTVLPQLFCSRVRAALFRILFGLREGETHLRAIQRQTDLSLGTVRQDVEKLVALGLVCRRVDGNRVCYAANQSHPLFDELHRIVLKTDGLADVLAAALRDDAVRCAFVFGSVAAGTAGAGSDIDLFVVGSLGLRKTVSLLSGVAEQLGRELNPHVLTAAEFVDRIRRKEHFVSTVMSAPKLFVKGSADELSAMDR
jgi:predicted nucleotidyltransferase